MQLTIRPIFYGTHRYITVSTKASLNINLSYTNPVHIVSIGKSQSIYIHVSQLISFLHVKCCSFTEPVPLLDFMTEYLMMGTIYKAPHYVGLISYNIM